MNRGLVHIYAGDGKGKTTAALGLALRARGNGLAVRLFQFMKSTPSGEQYALPKIDVSVERADWRSPKFPWELSPEEKTAFVEAQQALFDEACEAAQDKNVDLVVLDEALGAIEVGALDASEVAYLIKRKYRGTELVLTGRVAPKALSELADYVTEMRAVKHPYEQGQHARKGIEY